MNVMDDEEMTTTIYNSMSLYEYPNRNACKNIFRHPLINDTDRKRLRNFCRGFQSNPIEVEYIMTEPYGRYKLKNPQLHTAMTMWKKVRSNLYSATEYDIDIKNCHFNIVKNIIKVKLENLDYYLNNRDDVINLFIINENALNNFNKKYNDCLTQKDIIKTLFITILNGGSLKTIINKYEFTFDDIKLPEIYYKICDDIKSAKILIKEKCKDKLKKIEVSLINKLEKEHINKENLRLLTDKRYKKIKPFDKKNVDIPERKLIAILLQDEERLIIEKAIELLKSKNIKPTAYTFDGFQVLKTDIISKYECIDKFINILNVFIYGYNPNIIFENKSFVEPLNLNEIEEPKDEWDNKEFMDCTDIEKREYFETHIIKILNMDGFCYKIRGIEENGTTLGRIKNPSFFFGKGEIGKWFEKYIENDDIPTYISYSVYPDKTLCPNNIYNMWEGFRIENKQFENLNTDDVSIQNILNHFMITSNHNEKIYEYQLNWFAHKIQFPHKKIAICLIYMGTQGTGKTTICENLMKKLLGCQYICSTSNIETITNKFNSSMKNKLLCILNELNGKDTMPLMDRLKDIITRQSISIEHKGVDAIDMPDYCDYCFTTNNLNPIKETRQERRFQLCFPSDEKIGDVNYFTQLHKDINNDKIIKKFYEYLKARDLSKFHPENDRVRDTEEIIEMQEMNKCNIEEFIDCFFYDKEYRIYSKWLVKDIYKRFEFNQKELGFNNIPHYKIFHSKFINYKKWKDCYRKYKTNNLSKIEIDWSIVDVIINNK